MATDEKPPGPHLGTALREMSAAFERRDLRYALIGGVALAFRSRPWFTEDLAFLLEVPQPVLPGLLEDLAGVGFRFDATTVIQEWGRDHVAILHFGDAAVDWLKPILPCYHHVLDYARPEDWSGQTIRVAAAEDLIVLKLLAFRGQDRLDIENLLAANRGQLDLDRVRREWATVADASDARGQAFEDMVAKFYLPPPPSAIEPSLFP